ncbi:hypothetical protein HDK90DRAFT_6602 [Phyllosticta capitalensis]|uniref:Uncharacterized protein n=1 Tax=Phyllosticta capitalensis TaxID=121624 RepID=A0ABR1Z2K6_9PEZI
MHYLKKRPPEPTRDQTLQPRPLPPLSNNEALALWVQASHFFHRLHWTSAALLVTQILRRTSTSNMPRIARAKLWSNLGIVHFHLGEYYAALKAIEEALDEISALMGLTVEAADDEGARDDAAIRRRPGKARTATTTLTDFIRAGAARVTPPIRKRRPKRSSTPDARVPSPTRLRGEQEVASPQRVGKAATVTNTITTMGRFIRAGAAWSASPSANVDRKPGSRETGMRKATRSSRATQAATSQDSNVESIKSLEASCPAVPQNDTTRVTRTAKGKRWSRGTRSKHLETFQELHPPLECPPRPPSPLQEPSHLPFPPETPLLFFLAGLAAYHFPTTPESPINYFRVAHAYFKRCLWSLTLLSRNATSRPANGVVQNATFAAVDDDTYDEDYADEYGVDGEESLTNEQTDERAQSFDFSPYGFAFVLSRRSVITNTLTCDYEAECVEGRGTLVVGRCRGVEGLGAGMEGVWFEAPLG